MEENFNLKRLLSQDNAQRNIPNSAHNENSQDKLKEAAPKVDPKQSTCSGVGVIGVGTAERCKAGTDCSLNM